MSSNSKMAEYFEKRTAELRKDCPRIYDLGDRVRGMYKGIPWVGTVGNDTLRSEEEGPIVLVMLDLPMKDPETGQLISVIKSKHADMGRADRYKFELVEGKKNDHKRKAKASSKPSGRAASKSGPSDQ